jgi:polyferredoxin
MANKEIPVTLLDDQAHGNSSFYLSEAKIHPREVKGRFQTMRRISVVVLLGMFYLFPWLRWDGRQAVLFDLPARKFYVFGLNFWPQDFILLTMLLASAAMALFFFTTLAGRLWCGYACPQTVWTEVFLMIEYWCEGDRSARIRHDAAPWTREKVFKRGSKHLFWLLFALWTGITFVGFFSPIRELVPRAFSGALVGWEVFWIGFYSLATWGNAGVLREQVCKYMCPYARFQSAMFDRNTLLVAYDPRRGEPRGPRRKGALASVLARARGLLEAKQASAWIAGQNVDPSEVSQNAQTRERKQPETLGDCIDCSMCVQVCPTGIDIRRGLQYECIACGACIDACDQVMKKIDYPTGLIRYTSFNALEGRQGRILRPRLLIYGTILLLMVSAFAWGVAHRNELSIDILKDRRVMFRTTPGGIENDYILKLSNKTTAAHRYRLSVLSNAQLPAVRLAFSAGMTTQGEFRVGAESVAAIPFSLAAEAGQGGETTVQLQVERLDGGAAAKPVVRIIESKFFGPKSSMQP